VVYIPCSSECVTSSVIVKIKTNISKIRKETLLHIYIYLQKVLIILSPNVFVTIIYFNKHLHSLYRCLCYMYICKLYKHIIEYPGPIS